MRAMIASGMVPRAMAGRMRWLPGVDAAAFHWPVIRALNV